MGFLKIIALPALLSLAYVIYVALDMNATFDSFPTTPKFKCEYLNTPMVGPEKQIQYTKDIIISGSADFFKLFEGEFPLFGPHNTPNGQLFAINTKDKSVNEIKIIGYPKNTKFFPHGLDFKEKTQELFVLNHAFQYGNDRIDRFTIQNSEGVLTAHYKSSSLHPDHLNGILNDIIFITDSEYLATQYLPYPEPLFGRQSKWCWEDLRTYWDVIFLKKKLSYVHHCKYYAGYQSSCTRLENTASYMANGIAWNGRQQVLVADTLGKQINQYVIDVNATNKQQILKLQQTIPGVGGSDNIVYDRFRNQYVAGGIAKPLDHLLFVEAYKKTNTLPQNRSYTATVVKISEHTLLPEPVLVQDKVISGCSNAIQISDDEYLLGSWVDKSAVVCKRVSK